MNERSNETDASAVMKVTIKVEVVEAPRQEIKIDQSWTKIDETSKKVFKDHSKDINVSMSHGVDVPEVGGASVSGSIGTSWKRVSETTETGRHETSSSTSQQVKYQEGATQIYYTKTTTFNFLGGYGEHIEKVLIFTGKTDQRLMPGTKEYSEYEKTAWRSALGIDVPESRRVTTSHSVKVKRYSWEPIQRGNPIPENAIRAGAYGNDGMCYVGRFNGVPGKIDGDGGAMGHCRVQGEGCSTSAEILTTSFEYHWIPYEAKDKIPADAVGGMYKEVDGVLYVGKTHNNEVGKINSLDKKGEVLHRLWTHAQGCSWKGKVLTIDRSY